MNQHVRFSPRVIVLILLILFLLNLSALAWLGWPVLQNRAQPLQGLTRTVLAQNPLSDLPSPTSSPTTAPTLTATLAQPSETPIPVQVGGQNAAETLKKQGVLLLSLRDGKYAHLFAYHPDYLPLTRVTNTTWDEIDPAVSPDGQKLAYTSRQNGYWDLYLRDLESGTVQRLTDTPDYEGDPSWSADGQWLAYEGYVAGKLDIYLISVADPTQAPIRLTEDISTASAPAWSPQGRRIAYVSTRAGRPAIWLSDLDKNDADRSILISRSPTANASHPAWSRDGRYLVWAEDENGTHHLVIWDSSHPEQLPSWHGTGDQAVWSPDGNILFSLLEGPNQTNLVTYQAAAGFQLSPLVILPGQAYGLSWKPGPVSGWLAVAVDQKDISHAPVLFQPVITLPANEPAGRTAMITIPEVSAPVPLLSDAVDEAFQSLRLEAGIISGWDVLSSLENAYTPLTTPNDPGIQNNWLYTGRAFSLNPLLLSAGWMSIQREDFNGQTYWRVFLKARFQDGSAGIPMSAPTWDINARFEGDPQSYETGGQPDQVPSGYWIDLTELAHRFGWERVESLPNWRSYFIGIRFNQFVYRDGLDWNTAMLQLYPAEALASPTSVPTPTNTPTPTRQPTRTPTLILPTSTTTPTPTRRPTLTPAP
jgi:TolB protein